MCLCRLYFIAGTTHEGNTVRIHLVLLVSMMLPIGSAAQEEPKPTPPSMLLKMPGRSYRGELPVLTASETALAKSLRDDVLWLATQIGERNVQRYEDLLKAAWYIEQSFADCGYRTERHKHHVRGRECCNVIAERPGQTQPKEIIVIGAHYDSIVGSPGANDNASGVAGLLALARFFAEKSTARTLRFVAFTNEEPPYFQTDQMGSRVYARRCKPSGDNIVGMICLETIGCFSDEENSQKYPLPFSLFYPTTGNFIAFVANAKSAPLAKQVVGSFRRHAKFPFRGLCPARICHRGWMVGSLVVLARGLRSIDGYRHGPVSLRVLSHAPRHTGTTRLRAYGTRRDGATQRG